MAGDGGRVTRGISTSTSGSTRFTIAAGTLPPDVTLVIRTQTGAPTNAPAGTAPASAIAIAFAFAKGEVGPCEAVDAPAGAPPIPAAGAGGAPSLTSKEDGAGPSLDVAD